MALTLHIELCSETTFARGDGVAGLVDTEIEYDEQTGLPYIRGRTLKGLLVEECANLLYALDNHAAKATLEEAAQFMFGQPGSDLSTQANLRIGRAELPAALRDNIIYYVKNKQLNKRQVLESLTTIQRQTAVNTETGAPEATSLRSIRAVVRQTEFTAPLHGDDQLSDAAKGLLAASVLALRRGGNNRNRGSGKLSVSLRDNEQDVTHDYFKQFCNLLEVT